MIFLALGSNLHSGFGDRFKNINLAISYLIGYGFKIIKKSSFYETPSYPNKNNPKFINVIVSIESHLPPEDLMSVLILIENKLERERNKKNEPRTCDIDIIDYNNKVLNINHNNINLIIPHIKLSSRNFVLYPLQEISPEWKHPQTKEHISDLIQQLSEEDKMHILKFKKNDII